MECVLKGVNMNRKFFNLVFLLFIISLTAPISQAVTTTWYNTMFNRKWEAIINWDYGVPTSLDRANISMEGEDGPVIGSTITANAQRVYLGRAANGSLDILGGSLTVGDIFYVGYTGYTGTLNITSGTLLVNNRLQIGYTGGAGFIEMSGGYIKAKYVDLPYTGGLSGHLQLDSGLFICDTTFTVGTGGSGDIGDGTLTIPGNVTNLPNFSGWGIPGALIYSYDSTSNKTSVTADPNYAPVAHRPNPANGAVDVSPYVVLRWLSGINVADSNGHDVYFGDNFTSVYNATPASHPDVNYANVTDASFKPPVLARSATYYWRVDEINDIHPASPWKGSVWSFKVIAEGGPETIYNDITFYVTTDLHFNTSNNDFLIANQAAIEKMNSLPGTKYPSSLLSVDKARGVIITGDLTDTSSSGNWAQFTSEYGVNCEGHIDYPVYECIGNHDGEDPPTVVRTGVKARNPLRPLVKNISSSSLHYSWDWDDVHFVCLNLYPANVEDTMLHGNPEYALDFLSADLAANVGNSNRPVILYHHYGYDGWGLGWWDNISRTAFYNVIKNYNIIAIFWGHSHATALIDWNSIDTYGTPSSQTAPAAKGCWVVHIEPNGKFSAYERLLGSNTWGMSDIKTIKFTRLANRPSPADDAKAVETNTDLTWEPGDGASSYNIYFGTNFADVNNGTGGTFKGNQTGLIYAPGALSVDTVYYWRVDTVINGDPQSPYKGKVWSFDTYTTQLKKGPYLIFPGDNTKMTVLLQLDRTQTCTIQWGQTDSYWSGSVNTNEYGVDHQHKYTFTGLTPGTKYYYRVTSLGIEQTGTFYSASAASATSVKFLAYGDTRSQPAIHNSVNTTMVDTYTMDSGFQTILLHSGDWSSADTETAWATEFFDPAQESCKELRRNLPINGCWGNHEGSGVYYEKYYPYPYVTPEYWSFDYGPMHVAIIDQSLSYSTGSAQYNWLVNDLATSSKPWKFIVLHEPGYSAGVHGDNTSVQNYIQPLCVQYGVSIVFCGHNHYYARKTVDGVKHLTLGGGGAPLYDPNPSMVEVASKSYHFAKISINGNQLDFEALKPDGTVIDLFTLIKQGAPDTTPPTPNPMTWSTAPYSTSHNSVAMVASTASDLSGVEYYFACIAGGGHDSGWQDSTSYEDTGLLPQTQYTYTVTARDKSANHNGTAPSISQSATTPQQPPLPVMQPIVDVSARNLPLGTLTTWINDGNLGGYFTSIDYLGDNPPVVELIGGRKAVTFYNTGSSDTAADHMISSFNAPVSITGSGDWTVAAWVYNPVLSDYEYILDWTDRGTSTATQQYLRFSYGSNAAAGAIDRYGPDVPYAAIPAAGQWHHIAFTFSGGGGGGASAKVYVDGVLNNTVTLSDLNIQPNQPFKIGGGYWTGNYVPEHLQNPFSGSVARLQVYDHLLTGVEIADLANPLIDYDDLDSFINEWLLEGPPLAADFNGNGKVDFNDFAVLAFYWLNNCPSNWPWW